MTRYKKLILAVRVSIAENQTNRMILVLNITCFHVFFLRYKIIFFVIHFIVNTGGNQPSFCDTMITNFGSHMIENCFEIS